MKKVLSFLITDKLSGIDYYAVRTTHAKILDFFKEISKHFLACHFIC